MHAERERRNAAFCTGARPILPYLEINGLGAKSQVSLSAAWYIKNNKVR